nr:hypothetical protein Iba_chr14bCG0700 [Ipomoea batatas]
MGYASSEWGAVSSILTVPDWESRQVDTITLGPRCSCWKFKNQPGASYWINQEADGGFEFLILFLSWLMIDPLVDEEDDGDSELTNPRKMREWSKRRVGVKPKQDNLGATRILIWDGRARKAVGCFENFDVVV